MAGAASGQDKTDTLTSRHVQPLAYFGVIQVDFVKKNELYQRARSWFNATFAKSQNVLNIQDKETGELSGTATMYYTSSVFMGHACTSGTVSFVITVLVKDGRYKYALTLFRHEATVYQGNPAYADTTAALLYLGAFEYKRSGTTPHRTLLDLALSYVRSGDYTAAERVKRRMKTR